MNWKLYLAATLWFVMLAVLAVFNLHSKFWFVYDMLAAVIFAYWTGVDRERSKKND